MKYSLTCKPEQVPGDRGVVQGEQNAADIQETYASV